MLKIAICDDHIQQLENICGMVEDFIKAKPETDMSVSRFQSPHDLIECLDVRDGFHIYLLDILMPEMNGIDVGAKIREKDENAVIIYLTSSPDYAIKSYKVFAFQYLMKPVDRDELYKILDRAIAKINIESALILAVKTSDGLTALRYNQIMFVEYINHALRFHLNDNSVVTSITSRNSFDKSISLLLNDRRFVKPHVAFAVSMRFIRTITARDFVMTDGTLVSISQKNYANIKKRYIDFLLKGVTVAYAEHSR
jgi:two-component system LytT family response regulator